MISTTEQCALRTFRESDLKLEGDLRRFNGLNIKRLNEINCHRGKRHEIVYLSEGNGQEQMLAHDEGRKKTVTGKKK